MFCFDPAEYLAVFFFQVAQQQKSSTTLADLKDKLRFIYVGEWRSQSN